MQVEDIRAYLLAKPGATEELPFGPQALVYKVMGKMFALVAWDESPVYVSLKCDPDRALELRAVFSAVRGAYHFNKKHWNMVDLERIRWEGPTALEDLHLRPPRLRHVHRRAPRA